MRECPHFAGPLPPHLRDSADLTSGDPRECSTDRATASGAGGFPAQSLEAGKVGVERGEHDSVADRQRGQVCVRGQVSRGAGFRQEGAENLSVFVFFRH